METGIVIKFTGSWYIVKSPEKIIECKYKGKFKQDGVSTTNPIIVGDVVDFELINNVDKKGIITHIHERKNYIIRRSTNLSKQGHMIAANIDQAFLLVTLAFPKTSTTFIDRYLIGAGASKIPVILVFNKIDLYDDELMQILYSWKKMYEDIGYKSIEVSAVKNINLDLLRDLLRDKVSVFSGHSGVGKSTLINVIDPILSLRTDNISAYHLKGKHTTTFSEMFEVSSGGFVIDTPGIKGFGVLELEKYDIAHYFPEMLDLLKDCQYYNCLHIHEPGCAVKKALAEWKIAESRYISYLGLFEGEEDKYRS